MSADLLGPGSVAIILVGWAIAIVGIVKRTRYHRRRMAGRSGTEKASKQLIPQDPRAPIPARDRAGE